MTDSVARRMGSVWLRNFLPALAVLLVIKYALVANNIVGTEGYASAGKLLPKSLLLLGWDFVGAGLLAALITLLVLPLLFGRRGRADRPSVLVVSALVQGVHGVCAGFSFYTVLIVGGFINKAALDLAFLGSGGGQAGIWSSVADRVTVFSMSFLTLLLVLGAGGVFLAPRVYRWLRGWRRRVAVGLAVTFTALTTLLLPHLINGELMGIRVHTYGLDQSPGVEFARSYVDAMLFSSFGDGATIADEWRFDLTPPTAGAEAPPHAASPLGAANPLDATKPRPTSVVFVALESVAQPYVRQTPENMPFLYATGRSEDGVFLEQHYSTWPQTTKAFFSLLCSELPHPSYLPISATNPAIPCRSLPEVLRARGYHTALVTSADLAYERMIRFLRHRGFDVILDMRNLPGREEVWGNSWGVDERLAVKHVLAQVDAAGDRPFFIFYGMGVAHHPYNASAEHEANPLPDDRARYDRALRFIDDRLREVWDGLVARGLDDRTLLVLVSDHGEGFAQHGDSRSHGPKVYQENIHVPWAMRGPQLAGLRSVLDLPTSHIDVAPTILGLLGVPQPCTMKGRDLTHDSSPRLALFAGRPPGAQQGLVDGRLKYIREDSGLEMVFDVIADPDERADVLEQNRAKLPAWRARLDAWAAFSENLIERYAEIGATEGCLGRAAPEATATTGTGDTKSQN